MASRRTASARRLLHAIRTIAAGDALLAPAITRRLIAEFAKRPDPVAALPAEPDTLTERERAGRVLHKLGCHEVVALASETGIVRPGERVLSTAR